MWCAPRRVLVLAVLCFGTWSLSAADTTRTPTGLSAKDADLAEFRTVDTAVTTRISRAAPEATNQPGYLGIHVEADGRGLLVIGHVEPESPAARVGLRPGDVVRELERRAVASARALGDLLRSKSAGDPILLTVSRAGRTLDFVATLTAPSRPLSATSQRATMGVEVGEATGDGVRIERVRNSSPAAQAGLKAGDVIIKVDGVAIGGREKLGSTLEFRQPGEEVTVAVKRGGKEVEVKVRLARDLTGDPARLRWDNRTPPLWRKDSYRLAVLPLEFSDVGHNDKISTRDWERALFSRGVYDTQSPTGQRVYGSLNDYYLEQSCNAFSIKGKVFDWVALDKKRDDYGGSAGGRNPLLTEALDKLLARDGSDALSDFDGLFFVYAGDRAPTSRGGILWPHRSSLLHRGKRWAYFLCPEGGARMSSISVIAHEFGHMLGLPDLYARPEIPGSEGLGVWCTMSTGHGRDGKPLHFSAWCKEQLGWLKPAVIDPTVKQKLILAPVENSAKECFKVLIRPDGSEYLLLENRAARGFDRDLPAEGLLIWRVVDGQPVLEESHGLTGPDGPQRFLGAVPYPSRSNNAFTPHTTPSSKSLKGGGLPVHITNIRRLPDGRVTFYIGYDFI